MATTKATTKEKASASRPVLVTTAHRGVFFGFLAGEHSKASAQLHRIRNVVFWDVDTQGFLGLAEFGPSKKCRIGPAAATGEEPATVYDVTSVIPCSAEAVRKFEEGPWSR